MCISTAADAMRLEAEAANHSNCTVVADSKYSGGKALELTENNARINFAYNATERGKYDIYVGHDALYGDKIVNVTINGTNGTFTAKGRSETKVGTYFMQEGNNTITVIPSWTWFRIDYIRIEPSENTLKFDISPCPVDPDATEAARLMYDFLYTNFGKKTISGIMTGDMSGVTGSDVRQHPDMKAVYNASGKYPALVGFDFMNTTGRSEDTQWNKEYTDAVMRLARDTYRRGGLPNFTWHWRDPSRKTEEFYTDQSQMKITDAMNADGTWNTSSTLYKYILKDINTVATCLLALQKDGIACTFRPLHEASGGWFWWGREGAKPFKQLYKLIYHQMVEVRGVHNVIWIWNAGENDADWNPGDEYYDVVSADIYNSNFDYQSNYITFDQLKRLTGGKKIIALSENGPIPDIDREVEEEAVWSWWMPWYQTWNGRFVDKTSREQWQKCMNDPRIITLESQATGWGTAQAIAPIPANKNKEPRIYSMSGHVLSDKEQATGPYIEDGIKRIQSE